MRRASPSETAPVPYVERLAFPLQVPLLLLVSLSITAASFGPTTETKRLSFHADQPGRRHAISN